jgi:hypothetical protein
MAGRGGAGGDVASKGGGTRWRPFRIAESSLRGLGEENGFGIEEEVLGGGAGWRRDVCRVPFVISRPINVSLTKYEATLRILSPAVSRTMFSPRLEANKFSVPTSAIDSLPTCVQTSRTKCQS